MNSIPSTVGDIYIGQLQDGLEGLIGRKQVFIIADENTASVCVPLLPAALQKNIIIIPAGEKFKNIQSCQVIWSQLVNKKANRESFVLNIGGGMITDIGGFAASCYMRGLRFANIPTTVLSMTDASIGGKVGIDFDDLKNYIGLVNFPTFIWIDPVFLKTLPETEKIAGLAEVVKHAIIGSKELFDFLYSVHTIDEIHWIDIFEKSIAVKLGVVEEDPYESGLRKILNFGHTIGHALESFFLSKGQHVLHGNCVAAGMLVEARIANLLGLLNNDDFQGIVSLTGKL